MSRDYIDWLEDIIDAADKVKRFVDSVTFDEFEFNDEKVYATVRAIEIIGEATKQLPKPLTQSCPDVPWADIAGMRDKLIHGYFGVDLRVVWRTATESIPAFRAQVEKILSDERR